MLGLHTDDASTVNISGGAIKGFVLTHNTSTVNFTGGSLDVQDILSLSVDGGHVNFNAYDFQLGPGLSLSGNQVLGTGTLSGKWFGGGGAPWTVDLTTQASGAIIQAVPEPATLSLVGLGLAGPVLRRRGNEEK